MADTPVDWTPARFGRPAVVEWLRATPVLWGLALALVVLAGGTLRFHAIDDWDRPAGASEPVHAHPDERFIAFVANDIEGHIVEVPVTMNVIPKGVSSGKRGIWAWTMFWIA